MAEIIYERILSLETKDKKGTIGTVRIKGRIMNGDFAATQHATDDFIKGQISGDQLTACGITGKLDKIEVIGGPSCNQCFIVTLTDAEEV
jgi:hypothetical protein